MSTITSDVRTEVREWIEANWDPDLPLLEWSSRVIEQILLPPDTAKIAREQAG